MTGPTSTHHSLAALPDGATLRSVTATPTTHENRPALRVELTDDVTFNGQPGVDYVDQPTFVIVPATFRTGRLEVDICSRLNGKGPADARAFAGLAYHLTDNGDHFEAIYLRPLNGRLLNPPPPRHARAVQYFAYPDWPFDRLRDVYPDGRYEAGANIEPDHWIHLAIIVEDHQVTAAVDGVTVLVIDEPRGVTQTGDIGLFVDIGTQADFANLTITPAE